MLSKRDPDITAVLDAHEALTLALPDSSVKPFFHRCHAALKRPGTQRPGHKASQFPVCDHIPKTLRVTTEISPGLTRLVDAFGLLCPRLNWKRREGLKHEDPRFPESHANATLIGHDGIENHDSVRLGISLIAPDVTYPEHNHPPEEGYLVMGGGDWRQNHGEWFRREPGGTVHNTPNIWHAMRAREAPLLAFWMLWIKD